MNAKRTLRILLIQQFFPAYRIPVFAKLAAHPSIDLTLMHGTSPGIAPGEMGLQNVTEGMPFRVIRGPIPQVKHGTKALLWFSQAVEQVKCQRYDVVIHNFATRWVSLGRIRRVQQGKGGKFLLWGIGFSQVPNPLLDRLRVRMVGQADATILYSNGARDRYVELGAPARRLFVARNCVDFSSIENTIGWWTRERLREFQRRWRIDKGPVLLSVGRLAENKQLDLLLTAASRLRSSWKELKVVLIGSGPCQASLQQQAEQLGLGASLVCPGPITEEKEITPWFLSSKVVVAPGQIGLLAIHAAAYGCPLVTSDNPVLHGPEVETFLPGRTGLQYRYGDEHSLVEQIARLLRDAPFSEQLGKAGRRHIRTECGVGKMANGVLAAIAHATACPLELCEPYP